VMAALPNVDVACNQSGNFRSISGRKKRRAVLSNYTRPTYTKPSSYVWLERDVVNAYVLLLRSAVSFSNCTSSKSNTLQTVGQKLQILDPENVGDTDRAHL